MNSRIKKQSARARTSKQKKASVNTEIGKKKGAMGSKSSARKCPLVQRCLPRLF